MKRLITSLRKTVRALRLKLKAAAERIQHLETTSAMMQTENRQLALRPDIGPRDLAIRVIGVGDGRRELLVPAQGMPDLGEPVFVLKARDICAPDVVRAWAHAAAQAGSDVRKIGTAMQIAQEMDDFQRAHGCKVPDSVGQTHALSANGCAEQTKLER